MVKTLREKLIRANWPEQLEKIFFTLFLLSIPLQTRLIFSTSQTYLRGVFNEYATFYIYLSDIFLFITLFVYFVNSVPRFDIACIVIRAKKIINIFKNDNPIDKNIYLTNNRIFSVISHKLSTSPQLIPIILLFVFITWSFVSLLWAPYIGVAFFRALKLQELMFLLIYLTKRLCWFGLFRMLSIIFISATGESLIGAFQYNYQHSLDLKFLGESLISPSTDNVAKILLDGERVIRIYGTFPHPNIFGAFLIVGIFSGIWLLISGRQLSVSKNVSRLPVVASVFTNANQIMRVKQIVSRETISSNAQAGMRQVYRYIDVAWVVFLIFGTVLQIYALILTFSRLAWGGLFGVSVLLVILYLNKLFHVKQFKFDLRGIQHQIFSGMDRLQKVSLFIIFISAALLIGFYWNVLINRAIDSSYVYAQSIDNRILYKKIALDMISSDPWFGVGNGNFTLLMDKYANYPLEWWQYQPVHNIYLLIASELGVIGFIVFMLFIGSVLIGLRRCREIHKIVSRETIFDRCMGDKIWLFKVIIIFILLTYLTMGLYDHYFWSFQQGQLLFWFVIGVYYTVSCKEMRISE